MKRPRNPFEALIERYDIEADAYLAYWAPVLEGTSVKLVDGIANRAARRVLDIGAGAGTLLPVLAARFPDAEIIGVDRSVGMLSLCPAAAPVAVMDGLDLAFRDRVFDVAVMCFVLFHFADAVAGLSEARRVLKPGGGIYVSTWARDLDSPAVHIWNEELNASDAVAADEIPRLANHDLMDTPEKVEGILTKAGFLSARAAVHDFSYQMQLDDFIRLRTQVGSTGERFQTLEADARREFITRAFSKLARLTRKDFNLKMQIILASAQAP
jgi:SAM-dependent methyltransferase